VAVALCGIYIAYVFYLRSPQTPHRLVARFPKAYTLLHNKYYVDEIYNAAVINPLVNGSSLIYDNFDLKVIDGAINGAAETTGFTGKVLGLLQSGLVKDYALAILLGVILFMGYLLLF
jgi:NADH-quinone oxidoreductase subunit L